MRYLFDYAAELAGPLQEAIERFPAVHGIVVDVDRLWLAWWSLRERYGVELSMKAQLARYYPESLFARRGEAYRVVNALQPRWVVPVDVPLRPLRREDLGDFPEDWSEYWPRPGGAPLLFKFYCFPGSVRNIEGDLGWFGEYAAYVLEEHNPVQFAAGPKREHRPVLGGISVGCGSANPGTLGGILHDGNGTHYGVSCAHVLSAAKGTDVEQPSQQDKSTSKAIGRISEQSSLLSAALGSRCNPFAGSANDVDATLVEIGSNVNALAEVLNIGPVDSVVKIADMSVGQSVEFTGRTSGHRTCVVGGLGLTHRIVSSSTSTQWCYRNLFQIKSTGRRPPVRGGDSGSWVCMSQVTNYGWCGMIVGYEGDTGYATFAETIEDWYTNTLGLQLQP